VLYHYISCIGHCAKIFGWSKAAVHDDIFAKKTKPLSTLSETASDQAETVSNS